MTEEVVHDNQTGWINKHIQEYVDTGGARGHRFHGTDSLLITTRGRTSGQLRRTALYYGIDGGGIDGSDGERFVIVGSNGGKPNHPAWYLNLLADPTLEVQVGAEVFPATARTAEGEEEARLWAMMVGVFPLYAKYRAGTDRHIPVVVLQRSPS